MPVKIYSMVTCVLVCLTIFSLLFLHFNLNYDIVSAPKHSFNISILIWYWPFGRSYSLAGDICWDMYRIPGCHLHDNHLLFSHSDIVVFHHHELKTHQLHLPLHLHRPANQKWLWLSLESPASNGNLASYNGLFNWTMSYRRDADIFIPYGELVSKMHAKDDEINAFHENKSSLACWVISNYNPQQARVKVIQKLMKIINLDLYGYSFKRPLPHEKLLPTISQCHFYLAFENAQYKDYITEKLWRNSFQAGAVPVVLGPPRENYEAMVPHDSFIHVNDFKTVEELAEYLNQTTANPIRYRSYFKWHRNHTVKLYTDWRERLCKICTVYHKLPPKKIYQDLQGWANK
ncbi:alpha-(1,3)-fucosyltransferase 7 [Paramormyrops kingsleyae]|uniref:Fucosyltransferase n=1 Tax=Paramormyrops kingsleyae TaxID=1676925 RepID=A0A3B3SWX2_9TELE|nr:alpha-(1,3)-fucosyltransferase 7-like [Paramormyrops kingsleyae]XP_023687235.1 alpha-(1,3)-fucosyltransferase 7-like [Paramormyrops kingsleyae]